MNSISIPFKQKPVAIRDTNRANLSQNGLQKYTIPLKNNQSRKKKVFLIKTELLTDQTENIICEIFWILPDISCHDARLT